MVPVRRVDVMIHPRLGHARDYGSWNARSRRDIIGNVGLVGLVDDYGILGRDLLVQELWLNSNDTCENRRGQGTPHI